MLGHLIHDLVDTNQFEDVIVTSGDNAVLDVAHRFGATVARSQGQFRNGTQRVASAVRTLGLATETIINVQGDMPAVEHRAIADLVRLLAADSSLGCWTLSRACKSGTEQTDQNRVKVVVDSRSRACYFSRTSIPFGAAVGATRIHIGVYGFQPNQLMRYVESPMSELSVTEDLEQLDWMMAGCGIGVHHCTWSVPSVDQPSDVAELASWLRSADRKQRSDS